MGHSFSFQVRRIVSCQHYVTLILTFQFSAYQLLALSLLGLAELYVVAVMVSPNSVVGLGRMAQG